jgi:hypothetical protein
LRFLNKDEIETIMPMFEGAPETGKIKKSALRNWVASSFFLTNATFFFLFFPLLIRLLDYNDLVLVMSFLQNARACMHTLSPIK